jgi:hypothetical protein
MKCMIQQRHLPKQLDAPRGPTTAAATLERRIDTAMIHPGKPWGGPKARGAARRARGAISMTKPRRGCRRGSWSRSTKTLRAIELVGRIPRPNLRLQDVPGRRGSHPDAYRSPAKITALARRRRGPDHRCGRSRFPAHRRDALGDGLVLGL